MPMAGSVSMQGRPDLTQRNQRQADLRLQRLLMQRKSGSSDARTVTVLIVWRPVMATPVRAPSPAPGPLPDHQALGSLAFYRGLIALQDAQTAWWKGVERYTASLMQPWLDASGPVAQPMAAAVQSLVCPQFAEAAHQAWRDCGQLWLDALRHDASEA